MPLLPCCFTLLLRLRRLLGTEGGANRIVLESLQSLTQLEREARILLERDFALWFPGALYGILRLSIHFAVKMASGSGVGVGVRRFEGSGVVFRS